MQRGRAAHGQGNAATARPALWRRRGVAWQPPGCKPREHGASSGALARALAAFVSLSPDSPTLMFSTSLWMRIAFITFSFSSACRRSGTVSARATAVRNRGKGSQQARNAAPSWERERCKKGASAGGAHPTPGRDNGTLLRARARRRPRLASSNDQRRTAPTAPPAYRAWPGTNGADARAAGETRSAMRRALTKALRASVGTLVHEPPLRHLPLRVEAGPPWAGAPRRACALLAGANQGAEASADDCARNDAACGWRGAASQALLLPQPLLPASGAPRRSAAAVDNTRGWAAQQLPQTASFATAPRAGVTPPAAVAGMQRGGVRVVMVSPNVRALAAPAVSSCSPPTLVSPPSVHRLWQSRTRDRGGGCRSVRSSRELAGGSSATECVATRVPPR